MEGLVGFEGISLADIGAGGGFHACRYAGKAARVFAVEPAPEMLKQLYARLAGSGMANISVVAADAETIPLQSELVDVIHSRFAYFFGPERETVRSCEPGLREALRLLIPGGWFFIIDNALTTGQFAAILARCGYSNGQAADAAAERCVLRQPRVLVCHRRVDLDRAGPGVAAAGDGDGVWRAADRRADGRDRGGRAQLPLPGVLPAEVTEPLN